MPLIEPHKYVERNRPYFNPDILLTEIPDPLLITELVLDGCNLKSIKFLERFGNLILLSLPNNRITVNNINEFSSLTNLRVLDLSKNLLSIFTDEKIPPSLETLDLSYNKIEFIFFLIFLQTV